MSDPLAQITAAEHLGQLLLQVDGEVDMSNVDLVARQLRAEAADAPAVILNLTSLAFIDSQGLRMLQHLADEFTAAHKTLVIVASKTSIAGSMLALTGMEKALDVQPALP
jgi:anti-anti-sigma factor